MNGSQYVRLSRKKRSVMGSVQLWLGDGHILVVRSMRFTEEYRRFQLGDIQAVVATETPQLIWLEVGLFACSALSFLFMIEVEAAAARIFFGLIGAILAGTAVYDFARGQRCRCRLLTEVSAEVLEPVTRVSDYERLLRKLEPAIAGVQGTLNVDAGSLPLYAQLAPGVPLAPNNESAGSATAAGRLVPYLFYIVILANAAAYALGYLGRYSEGFGLALSFWFGEIVLGAMLVLRPRRFGLKGPMLGLVYLTTALIALDAVSTLVQLGDLFRRIADAGRTGARTPTIWDIEWMMTAGKVAIAWRSLAGVVGLLALWLGRDRVASADGEAPPSQPPL
ncbi:MAG: hypothetical protein JST65_17705 [Acidobacteria bacterium]|nr:hypothetical protein [Acidobacteriota bacterium]